MLLEHNKNGNLYRINLQKTAVKYTAFIIKLITNTFGVYFLRENGIYYKICFRANLNLKGTLLIDILLSSF